MEWRASPLTCTYIGTRVASRKSAAHVMLLHMTSVIGLASGRAWTG
jgi:hypothetical protein